MRSAPPVGSGSTWAPPVRIAARSKADLLVLHVVTTDTQSKQANTDALKELVHDDAGIDVHVIARRPERRERPVENYEEED